MNEKHPPAGGTSNRNLIPRGARRGVTRAVTGLGITAVLAGSAVTGAAAASAAPVVPAATVTHVTAGHHRHGLAAELARVRHCFRVADALRRSHHPRLARATFRRCETMLRRDFRGLYGEVTYKTRTGSATLGYEQGRVTAISGAAVTVRAANSTAITWTTAGNTVLTRYAHWVPVTRLAVGQRVFVIGPVISGVSDARLIMIGR